MNDDFTEADEHRIWRAEDQRDWGGEYPTTRAVNFSWDWDPAGRDDWMSAPW